ncbi:DUF4231 domain-containing protein [Gemmobacter aquarius]|uniref:DUF4231 domain-containing protein n=1 Tax=Paragemmobacter aquarius TaxID=2169400 RepID=A0A2S0UR00_9RHOB|nr:DUF4231 domain-containing protein [Gemmobacter aquarius]
MYHAAGDFSDKSQQRYFRLIILEYALLIVASFVSANAYEDRTYYAGSALIFLITMMVAATRNWLKPEQDWYKGRALAESIKTSSWRYAMRSAPFGNENDEAETREEFQQHLRLILDANRSIGDKIPADRAAEDQITSRMGEIRASDWMERLKFYREHRVNEQLRWYTKRAEENKNRSTLWVGTAIIIYLFAIAASLMRIAHLEIGIIPVDTFILAASTIVGWTQIKKFNELASSYTLTAHEIGLTFGPLRQVKNEEQLAKFVLEAEQAFSREHTQWVARQSFQ